MSDTTVLAVARDALVMTLMLSAPVLGVGLIIGLIVSVFQAATQVNEMTLAYVPKILAVFGVIALLGPWMLNTVVTYTTSILSSLPELAK